MKQIIVIRIVDSEQPFPDENSLSIRNIKGGWFNLYAYVRKLSIQPS